MSRQPRPVPERVEQAHIVQLVRSVGGQAWVLGTTRRKGDYAGTMQTPGIPDLVTFIPLPTFTPKGERCGVHSVLLFIEVKAVGGRLRPEQIVFRDTCHAAGVQHVVGGLDAVLAWMVERGVVKAENVPHHRRPTDEQNRSAAR